MSNDFGQRYMNHAGVDISTRTPKRNIDIQSLTDSELEDELKRRKELANQPPKPLDNPDYSNLRTVVISVMETAVKDHYAVTVGDHYIYEAAVEAVYGKDFWKWWNNQKWR